jgi:hypothetical protein
MNNLLRVARKRKNILVLKETFRTGSAIELSVKVGFKPQGTKVRNATVSHWPKLI